MLVPGAAGEFIDSESTPGTSSDDGSAENSDAAPFVVLGEFR